jgi:hypothetical protein
VGILSNQGNRSELMQFGLGDDGGGSGGRVNGK